jgi:hypothetical protein
MLTKHQLKTIGVDGMLKVRVQLLDAIARATVDAIERQCEVDSGALGWSPTPCPHRARIAKLTRELRRVNKAIDAARTP